MLRLTHRHILHNCLYILLVIASFSCQPQNQALTQKSSQTQQFELPDEVMLYGGLDQIQNWLMNAQKYAQNTYPQTPMFAMMIPFLFAQQIGVTNPQALDLKGSMRWFAVPKSKTKSTQSVDALSKQALIDRWDSLILFQTKNMPKLKASINKQLWKPLNENQDRFSSKIPDQPGFLYLQESYLILCSHQDLCEKHYPSLINYVQYEKLKDFTCTMRPQVLPIQRWIHQLKETQGKEPNKLYQLLAYLQDTESFSVSINTSPQQVALEVQMNIGDDVVTQKQLTKYVTDARPLLSKIPTDTRGVVAFQPAIFTDLWKLVQQQKSMQHHLRQASGQDLSQWLSQSITQASLDLYASYPSALFVDTNLQLAALIQGQSKTLQPLLHQAMMQLKGILESQKWQTKRVKKSTTPLQFTLKTTQNSQKLPMDTLTLLNPPAQVNPQLQDLEVQMSEVRALYTPEMTYVGFGPKSHQKITQLSSQESNQMNHLLTHFKTLGIDQIMSKLSFMFYITPQVIEDVTEKLLPVKGDQSKKYPQKIKAGMSLLMAAYDAQNYFVRVTIPVDVAQRFSTAFHLFKALMNPPKSSAQ